MADEGTVEPQWVRLESIDLSKIVKIVQADPTSNLDNIIEDGHRTEFEQLETLPLWHIVAVVQDTELKANQDTVSFAIGFFFHHGISDGTSGAGFHLSFLEALNGLTTGATKPISKEQGIISVPKLPLLPTVETKFNFPLSIWFTVKMIFTTFVYSAEDPLHWWGPTVTSTPPEKPPTVKLQSFDLPHEMVKSLVAKCRSEGSTVTSLISVLVARKLALMYPAFSRFTASVPIDLRKLTGNTSADMGCFVSDMNPLFSSEAVTPRGYISCASDPAVAASHDTKLWESARASKALMAARASSKTDHSVGLLKFIKDNYAGHFMGYLGKRRQAAFEVTNIMVVDGGAGVNDSSKATFDRVMFSASTPKHGYPYCILLATAKNGSMTSTLAWEEGVMENGEASELIKWLETSLGEIAGQ